MKKVYISARAKHRMDDVRQIIKIFKNADYEVSYDWTDAEVKRPYRQPEHRRHNMKFFEDTLKAATNTDIYILLDDPDLRGAYVELGAFLYSCLHNHKNRMAYIVGPDSHNREHVYESPEYIRFCDGIEEVYKDLGIVV